MPIWQRRFLLTVQLHQQKLRHPNFKKRASTTRRSSAKMVSGSQS